MKRVNAAILFLLLAGPALFAQSDAPGVRVAVMNRYRAVTEVQAGQRAMERIMAEVGELEAAMDVEEARLIELQNRRTAEQATLTADAMAALTRQITQIETNLMRMGEDAQREVESLEMELLTPIFEVMSRVVRTYADEVGFAVIFDVSTEASGIVYARDAVDITTEIIRRVDAEMARAGVAPATPAAPAANNP